MIIYVKDTFSGIRTFDFISNDLHTSPFSIDATDNLCMARMVNDVDRSVAANCKMKKVTVDGIPRLGLFALVNIKENDELRYDYGCNDVPWRKVKVFINILLLYCYAHCHNRSNKYLHTYL